MTLSFSPMISASASSAAALAVVPGSAAGWGVIGVAVFALPKRLLLACEGPGPVIVMTEGCAPLVVIPRRRSRRVERVLILRDLKFQF